MKSSIFQGVEYEEEEEEHKDHMDPEFLTFTALDTPENVQQVGDLSIF